MNGVQIIALVIFIAMFILMITEVIERQYATLGCALCTIIFVFGLGMHSGSAVMEALNVKSIFTTEMWYTGASSGESATSGINWETIIFIAGMMIMVEGLERAGFFKWLCAKLAKAVNYKPMPLLMVFMLLSAVLAMFVDSITVVLFLAAATVQICKLIKMNPVPMILAEIFCANLGGSATMCGDPPNIIMGTSLGYSFADFITNTGLMAGISLIFIIVYYCLVFHKQLKAQGGELDQAVLAELNAKIEDKRKFGLSTCVFLLAIVLLVTHAQSGLTVAAIGVIAVVLTFLINIKDFPSILKAIDSKTLAFFIGLFVVVYGLEATGILEILANFVGDLSGGNLMVMVAIIIWISAIASAFIDNIPFMATMLPIITSLSGLYGVPLATLSWALSMGCCIGGSATPIGASANVVGTSISAKSGHPISWGKYLKYNAPATIIVIVISMVTIFIRYC